MSTTITCLEKIDIRRGDKDADDARLYLVKYLHQFIDMVGILSLEVYDFAIEIEGDLRNCGKNSPSFMWGMNCRFTV